MQSQARSLFLITSPRDFPASQGAALATGSRLRAVGTAVDSSPENLPRQTRARLCALLLPAVNPPKINLHTTQSEVLLQLLEKVVACF